MDKSVGIAAAVVPANKRGMTCPKPKHAKRITPLAGFPFSAIQAKRTAKTGVVQGEDASPNVNPAAIGKSGAGIFSFQISIPGPFGSLIFSIPRRFNPIRTIMIGTSKPISEGI